MTHDKHIVTLFDNSGNGLGNQSGFDFILLFKAGRNTAVKFILRLVLDGDLITAAALRHVECLFRRIVGIAESLFFSDADR